MQIFLYCKHVVVLQFYTQHVKERKKEKITKKQYPSEILVTEISQERILQRL